MGKDRPRHFTPQPRSFAVGARVGPWKQTNEGAMLKNEGMVKKLRDFYVPASDFCRQGGEHPTRSQPQPRPAPTRVKQVEQVHHEVLVDVPLGDLGVGVAGHHVPQQELVHNLGTGGSQGPGVVRCSRMRQ